MFLSDLPLTINKERPFQGKIEIVRHCINMNKRIFSLFIPETINFRIIPDTFRDDTKSYLV